MYAKPYSHGKDNPLGIVVRRSTDTSVTKRESVGAVYGQIVDDLLDAIRLFGNDNRRRGGNAGYASKEAAQGLLTRVYLYMEENEEVIKLANEILGAAPASKIETTENFPNYFANALASRETLWAVAHLATESKAQSSIGSMYLTHTGETGAIGWGEIYPSDHLKNLYERYPHDIRYGFIVPDFNPGSPETAIMVYWPVEHPDNDFRFTENRYNVVFDAETQKYYFTEGSARIYVETEKISGTNYDQHYITWQGQKQPVRINRVIRTKTALSTIPSYYMTKFSYQDGDPMLSSPVMIRWAEVILNRAEAYAKTEQDQKALDDVNVLRTRAGLSGNELFTLSNMGSKGYNSVLDVVLDERRLELAFEGHRMFDVYRNKRDMNREFAGAQPWEIVKWDENKIQYPIPFYEISVSGIEQNPR